MPPPSEEEKEKEQNEENELDQIIYTQSPDSGWRLQLNNIVDNLTYLWNERANVFRYEFDILQRPLMEWVDEGSGEKLTTYKVYGDWNGVPNPRKENLKNKEIYNFDQSGALANTQFDFKENLLQNNRQLALNYQDTIDWSLLIGEQTLAELKVAADTKLQTLEYSNLYEFDAFNRLILKTQPDGSKYSYSFNKAALLEKVATQLQHENSFTDMVNNITYNAREQKTAIYYANGSQTKNTYDQETFRIIRILTTRNTGQDIMQDLNYTFDAVGNITEQVDNAQQTQYFSNSVIDPANKYRYDSLYRLVQATGREKGNLSAPSSSGYQPDWIPTNGKSSQSLATYCEQYSYDKAGNILELVHKDTCGGSENWKRSYVYNNNTTNNYLLSAYTGSTPPTSPQFSYDAHGNMLEMPHLQAMNWDYADQMNSTQKTGETTYYVYSGGERIRKIVVDTSGTTEKIKYERIYLGEYELYRKYDSSGALETETLTYHVKDESLAMVLQEVKKVNESNSIENPTTITRYQYGDQLDSAKLELNQNAEVLSYEEYYPFGTTSFEMHTNDSEVSLKRYKYVHKERDSETGLYYYGARYYAAWLCRFTACDPKAVERLNLSPYNYVQNNPLNRLDPNGMIDESAQVPPDFYEKLDEEGNATGEVIWLEGNQEHEGFKHLGTFHWERNIDGEGTNRFYDGTTKSSYLGKGAFNPSYTFEKSYVNSSTLKDFLIGYIDGPASAVQIFGDTLITGFQTAGIGVYEMFKGGDMDSRNFYLEGYEPLVDINNVLTYNNGEFVWTDVSSGTTDGIPIGINFDGLDSTIEFSKHTGEQGFGVFFAKSALKVNSTLNLPSNLKKLWKTIFK